MNQREAIKYWITSAKEDWEVAQSLLKMKRGENLKIKLNNILK